MFEATKSPVAQEAIRRIAALYKIEHEIDDAGEVTALERSRLQESRAGPIARGIACVACCDPREEPAARLAGQGDPVHAQSLGRSRSS